MRRSPSLNRANSAAISTSPAGVAATRTSRPSSRVRRRVDEAAPLERADDAGQRALRDAGVDGELPGLHLAPHPQHPHHRERGERQPDGGQHGALEVAAGRLATRNTLATAAIEAKSRSTSSPARRGAAARRARRAAGRRRRSTTTPGARVSARLAAQLPGPARRATRTADRWPARQQLGMPLHGDRRRGPATRSPRPCHRRCAPSTTQPSATRSTVWWCSELTTCRSPYSSRSRRAGLDGHLVDAVARRRRRSGRGPARAGAAFRRPRR